jgi:hypothetical protein
MRVVILYRPNSEHARVTEEFIHNLTSRYPGIEPEVMNLDTRAGAGMAADYDIMQYPGMLVLMDDGSIQKEWQGTVNPL